MCAEEFKLRAFQPITHKNGQSENRRSCKKLYCRDIAVDIACEFHHMSTCWMGMSGSVFGIMFFSSDSILYTTHRIACIARSDQKTPTLQEGS